MRSFMFQGQGSCVGRSTMEKIYYDKASRFLDGSEDSLYEVDFLLADHIEDPDI